MGMLLTSNAGYSPLRPAFAVKLGPVETRDAVWNSMRQNNVCGRTFSGFLTLESFAAEVTERFKLELRFRAGF